MDTAADEAIARALLAQDQEGYCDLPYVDNSADSDYSEGGKRRRRRPSGTGRGRKGRAPKARSDAGDGSDQEAGGGGSGDEAGRGGGAGTGRRPRKDIGIARVPGRQWTEEEEELFVKALERHGRDWKRAAEVVVSRDNRQIASHAQKYLVKLCLAGQPLPAAVAASGRGYTLSGTLLDPYSSAARSYGFRPDLLTRLPPDQLQVALSGLDVERLPVQYGGRLPDELAPVLPPPRAEERARKPPSARGSGGKRRRRGAATPEDDDDDNDNASPTDPAAYETAAAAANGLPSPSLSPHPDLPPYGNDKPLAMPVPNGRRGGSTAPSPAPPSQPPQPPQPATQTEYARNRPRRELAGQRAQLGVTSESLQLVRPIEYAGMPGSGGPLSQPFSVEVAAGALLAMDFHAHLSTYEVIGLLGGAWSPSERRLVVHEAYGCRRAAGSGAATSVELDPAAQVEVQCHMEQRGQICVGWYHSHPVFEPSPSQKDMTNQRNYQALFRCGSSKLEPFLAFIVGPYDLALASPMSAVSCFLVQSQRGNLVPFAVRYQITGLAATPDEDLAARLASLLDACALDPGRVDFGEIWRSFSQFLPDRTTDGPPISRMAKLRAALAAHMREAAPAEVERALGRLVGEVAARWGGGGEAAASRRGDEGAAGAGAAGEAATVTGEGAGEAAEAGEELGAAGQGQGGADGAPLGAAAAPVAAAVATATAADPAGTAPSADGGLEFLA